MNRHVICIQVFVAVSLCVFAACGTEPDPTKPPPGVSQDVRCGPGIHDAFPNEPTYLHTPQFFGVTPGHDTKGGTRGEIEAGPNYLIDGLVGVWLHDDARGTALDIEGTYGVPAFPRPSSFDEYDIPFTNHTQVCSDGTIIVEAVRDLITITGFGRIRRAESGEVWSVPIDESTDTVLQVIELRAYDGAYDQAHDEAWHRKHYNVYAAGFVIRGGE